MALSKKTRELHEKRERLLMGGGEKAIEKQKAMGKRTARERILALLDENSFNEYDMFVEHLASDFDMDRKSLPSDGVIIGTGTIMRGSCCYLCPGLYCCRRFSWTGTLKEDYQDYGSCTENENSPYWYQ